MAPAATQVPDSAIVSGSLQPLAVPAPAGLVAGVDPYGPTLVSDPASTAAPRENPDLSVCVLAEYGLISVLGPEARKFLNSQSTNDVLALAEDGVQLDGYCTPKGRLLASFTEWPSSEGIYLATARALAAPITKRLSMYVFRAKLKVRDESDGWYALGLQGSGLAAAMDRLGMSVPGVWKLERKALWTALGLPEIAADSLKSGHRIMLWVPAADLGQVLGLLGEAPRSSQAWRAADIEAGLPRIVPASSELFVPQMLNFDLINAVNFKKGCFPGQEIVARSQYLGKLKRRMLKGSSSVLPAPGDDIHAPATTPGVLEPVGKVVMAAAKPGVPGRFSLLMELQLAQAGSTQLTVDGASITIEPLPYAFPAEKSK